jgi:ubiquinone/menaquinone biosynthesis C-methylase UbiE
MKLEDYQELGPEMVLIQSVKDAIQMWNPAQHQHRHWEYALALKAFRSVFGEGQGFMVSDHGCGAGFLSPMLSWLGQIVRMYDCWTMSNDERYMLEQMRRVRIERGDSAGSYEFWNRPLGELVAEDNGVDAAFCISTLEHIGEYQKAFRDLLRTVRLGGLVFVTTDFAEDQEDHYQYAWLRAGKMFNEDSYRELCEIAGEEGFLLLGGEHDWTWNESCRLVNDYGFGALAMWRVRREEVVVSTEAVTGKDRE